MISRQFFLFIFVTIAFAASNTSAFFIIHHGKALAPLSSKSIAERSRSARFMSDGYETKTENEVESPSTERVTMRSLNFEVTSKPFGIVLEEMNEGGVGVYCAECDPNGAAYAAGIRDGDVLASLHNDEKIFSSNLEDAMALLGEASLPVPITVYRPLEQIQVESSSSESKVNMAPRRMPSAKKLVKASTNANFWKDPLMIGSAVITVGMPVAIYVFSGMGNRGM